LNEALARASTMNGERHDALERGHADRAVARRAGKGLMATAVMIGLEPTRGQAPGRTCAAEIAPDQTE
jgi:hypothetical protein